MSLDPSTQAPKPHHTTLPKGNMHGRNELGCFFHLQRRRSETSETGFEFRFSDRPHEVFERAEDLYKSRGLPLHDPQDSDLHTLTRRPPIEQP